MRFAHEAQVMPSIGSSTRSVAVALIAPTSWVKAAVRTSPRC